jgi:type III restriction enzyme
MKFELKEYQREAVAEVLKRLAKARMNWRTVGDRSAFPLSAMTGSGKTVIATAVIEALIFGSADFDVEADGRAAFLWVTDDPALNRQTLNKMLAASELMTLNQLVELDANYLDPTLKPGRVYFLNIQKLSKTAAFANAKGDTFRSKTGWELIGDTVNSPDVDLVVIVDEAHRGMAANRDRASIVRRIIDGQPGWNYPAPIVWGISATIERFKAAMGEAPGRDLFQPVDISVEKVQAEGLVKEQIELDKPNESGTFGTTLLREAVAKVREFDDRWAAYAAAENERRVYPALVVQVADKASQGDLAELVSVIEQEWPGLDKRAIVNVFGEHVDRVFGTRTVRYLAPELIEDDQYARVVLAKEAISTGWDCPRAEVLYSDRPASDVTHIAQVIGRMVRQPLARRIVTDDELNSVSCFLPRFDRTALDKIVEEISKPGEVGAAAEVVVHTALFGRNAHVDPLAFGAIESVPCLLAPRDHVNPIRRARALTKLLTDTSRGEAMLPGANELLTKALNDAFAGLAVQHKDKVAAGVVDIETMEVGRVSYGLAGERKDTGTRSIATAARDIERDTRRIVNSVKEGAAQDYLRHVVETAGPSVDILAERTKVAALVRVDGVIGKIEATADEWVRQQFTRFRTQIKNTTGAQKDAFLRVQAQTSEPEASTLELLTTLKSATHASNAADAEPLPTFAGHVFADPDGLFPAKLNGWETAVIETEVARPEFVAWYRNPPRATTDAHRIAYATDDGGWASLQVDFLLVSKRADGSLGVSLIDPHGTQFADSRAKLVGLARFAEQFGDQFVRIESIAELDGTMRLLDIQQTAVRKAILDFTGSDVTGLFTSNVAEDY